MPRPLGAVASVCVAIAATLAYMAPAHADVAPQLVTESDIGSGWFRADTRVPGTGTFETGPATPPLGAGSFELATPINAAKVQLLTNAYDGVPLSAIDTLSYSTYRDPSSTGFVAGVAALNIRVDSDVLDGNLDGAPDHYFVYEPYQDFGNDAVETGTWQSWDAYRGGAAKWWVNNGGPTTCGQSNPCTWTTLLATYPGATIREGTDAVSPGSLGVNQGSFNAEIVSNVDAISVGVSGQTTIYDLEPLTAAAELSIADVSVTEGDSGTTLASFTISRSADTAGATLVEWSTADGSAVAPDDYTAVTSTSVTFAAGETTKTVSVSVNGDTAVEANDGFIVNLSAPEGGLIMDGQAVGRILNDDVSTFSVDDVTVAEGDSGTSTAAFTVSRSGATGGPASVQWRTLDAQAKAGTDYVAVPFTTLTFAAGETAKPVSVTINGDATVEADETFYLRLSSPVGGTVADGSGVGRITNDDVAVVLPTLSVNDVTVTEGDAGTTSATFTITRAGSTTGASSVQWFTADGTATSSADYVPVAATVVEFAAGETTKTVTVDVNGDTAVEANETYTVRLTAPVGATIADGSGLGRITNDDASTFAVSDTVVAEGNSGTTIANFNITRSGAIGGPASVQWSTANGTAVAPDDYISVAATTVNFAAGEGTVTVSVSINGDLTPEANETFVVRLAAASGASIADGSGLGRITNDD
jgi:hypothetical protein